MAEAVLTNSYEPENVLEFYEIFESSLKFKFKKFQILFALYLIVY